MDNTKSTGAANSNDWLDIVLDIIPLAFVAFLIIELCQAWYSPKPTDADQLASLSMIMPFEFLVLNSAIFLFIIKEILKGFFWFVMVVFYGFLAWEMSKLLPGHELAIAFLVVVLGRSWPFFKKTNKDQNISYVKTASVRMAIFFLVIFPVVYFSDSLPDLGLTSEFLNDINYQAVMKDNGENPITLKMFIIFSLFYFLIIWVMEFRQFVNKIKSSFI